MQIEATSTVTTVNQTQVPGEPTSTGQVDAQNVDTLSSYGCCDAPYNFVTGVLSWISSSFISIKDWILSFFCTSTPRTSLTGRPDERFRDATVALYDKVSIFHALLSELTEAPRDNGYRPAGMSDEEMKTEIIALFNTDLPIEIKNALEHEFQQPASSLRSAEGFPRNTYTSFADCLTQDPVKAKAIAFDVRCCQPSFYESNVDGIPSKAAPLDKLKSFQQMLLKCEVNGLPTLCSIDEFVTKIAELFVLIPVRYQEQISENMQDKSFLAVLRQTPPEQAPLLALLAGSVLQKLNEIIRKDEQVAI